MNMLEKNANTPPTDSDNNPGLHLPSSGTQPIQTPAAPTGIGTNTGASQQAIGMHIDPKEVKSPGNMNQFGGQTPVLGIENLAKPSSSMSNNPSVVQKPTDKNITQSPLNRDILTPPQAIPLSNTSQSLPQSASAGPIPEKQPEDNKPQSGAPNLNAVSSEQVSSGAIRQTQGSTGMQKPKQQSAMQTSTLTNIQGKPGEARPDSTQSAGPQASIPAKATTAQISGGRGQMNMPQGRGQAIKKPDDPRPELYEVVRHARVRSGIDLESDHVTDLVAKTIVHVVEIKGRRARIVKPQQGWLSKETSQGETVLKAVCDERHSKIGSNANIYDEETGVMYNGEILDFSEGSGLYFVRFNDSEMWINLTGQEKGKGAVGMIPSSRSKAKLSDSRLPPGSRSFGGSVNRSGAAKGGGIPGGPVGGGSLFSSLPGAEGSPHLGPRRNTGRPTSSFDDGEHIFKPRPSFNPSLQSKANLGKGPNWSINSPSAGRGPPSTGINSPRGGAIFNREGTREGQHPMEEERRKSAQLREQQRVHECFDVLLDTLRKQGRRGQYPDPNLKIHDPIKYYSQKRELWLRAYKMAQNPKLSAHLMSSAQPSRSALPNALDKGQGVGSSRSGGMPMRTDDRNEMRMMQSMENQKVDTLRRQLFQEKLKRLHMENKYKHDIENLKLQNLHSLRMKKTGVGLPGNSSVGGQSSRPQIGALTDNTQLNPTYHSRNKPKGAGSDLQETYLLTIIRGMPGSGKSTLARKLADRHGQQAYVCCSQKYLWSNHQVGVGTYVENKETVTKATKQCTEDCIRVLHSHIRVVIVDRLNSKISDYEDLIRIGVKLNYKVVIIEFKSDRKYIPEFRRRSQRRLNDEQWNYLENNWEFDPRAELIYPAGLQSITQTSQQKVAQQHMKQHLKLQGNSKESAMRQAMMKNNYVDQGIHWQLPAGLSSSKHQQERSASAKQAGVSLPGQVVTKAGNVGHREGGQSAGPSGHLDARAAGLRQMQMQDQMHHMHAQNSVSGNSKPGVGQLGQAQGHRLQNMGQKLPAKQHSFGAIGQPSRVNPSGQHAISGGRNPVTSVRPGHGIPSGLGPIGVGLHPVTMNSQSPQKSNSQVRPNRGNVQEKGDRNNAQHSMDAMTQQPGQGVGSGVEHQLSNPKAGMMVDQMRQ